MISYYEVFDTKVRLMQQQLNVCPICEQTFSSPTDAVLDHDHDTGFVRAALHDNCNKLLGFIEAHANVSGIEEITTRIAAFVAYHKRNPLALVHPKHSNVKRRKIVKIPRLLLTPEEKLRFKGALAEGALPHPSPKKKTSREGSWNRTAKKYSIPYDRLLAYVNGLRPLTELD